ncbi:MAG: hypothetical protein C0179_04275 [Fervidicoccus sp.]|nr:MAG: hypothetical protein C0179_04275 [Fervidicoccus sp.]
MSGKGGEEGKEGYTTSPTMETVEEIFDNEEALQRYKARVLTKLGMIALQHADNEKIQGDIRVLTNEAIYLSKYNIYNLLRDLLAASTDYKGFLTLMPRSEEQ